MYESGALEAGSRQALTADTLPAEDESSYGKPASAMLPRRVKVRN